MGSGVRSTRVGGSTSVASRSSSEGTSLEDHLPIDFDGRLCEERVDADAASDVAAVGGVVPEPDVDGAQGLLALQEVAGDPCVRVESHADGAERMGRSEEHTSEL